MRLRALFACILLAALGLTGCKTVTSPEAFVTKNTDATRAAIQTEIQDPARSAAMLAIVDAFAADTKAIAQDAKAVQMKISTAEADYDTSRAQLQGLYDDLGKQLGKLCDTAKEHSLALRKQCSEAEWKAIVGRKGKGPKLNFK